jgi:hypothetical protein
MSAAERHEVRWPDPACEKIVKKKHEDYRLFFLKKKFF